MKRFFVTIVAVCVAFMLAAPAMADIGGNMRVRGFAKGNTGLDTNQQDSDAYYDTRIRMQGVLKPTDKISLTLRADILDGYKLGTVSADHKTSDEIDLDRAYLTVLTDFGKLDIGRMAGGNWGTVFGDSEQDYDRIKFTLPYNDNLTLIGVFQKTLEEDAIGADVNLDASGDATVIGSDQDNDTYSLAGIYKLENATLGLLGAYANYRALGTTDINKRVLIPYFKAQFGDLGIQGELIYEFGDIDRPDGEKDGDISGMSYNIEVTYDIPGPFSFEAGYASASGNDNPDVDLSAGNTTYGGIGEDWDKFVIFSDADCLLNTPVTLPVTQYGVKLWYLGAKYALTEDITLWGNIGGASADQAGDAIGDGYGTEFDINMTWKIMDNMTYTIRLGFLNTGDVWKNIRTYDKEASDAENETAAKNFEVDDTFTFYHKLQVDF